MTHIEQISDLEPLVGQAVATSEWVVVEQAAIDQFAQATGDHQWIHVDPERAAKGPFGTPIAHGFLTLSLLPKFFETALHIAQSGMGINCGLNRVRFPAPVPVGSRLRAHLTLNAFEWVDNGGAQLVWGVTVEREGQAKPVCVAESVVRRYP